MPAGGQRTDVLADIVRVRVCPEDLDLTHGCSKIMYIYGFFFLVDVGTLSMLFM